MEIITAAKAEYFKKHPFEKVISFVQKRLIFGLGVNLMGMFTKNIKGKTFDKKVIYFGGCGGEVKGNKSVVTLLNACGIEVITPHFKCCGIPLYVRGDIDLSLIHKMCIRDRKCFSRCIRSSSSNSAEHYFDF